MDQNVPTGQDTWDVATCFPRRPSLLHLGGDRPDPAVQLCRYCSERFVSFSHCNDQHDYSVSPDQRPEGLGSASVEGSAGV